jgi:hypothetical protein
MKNGLARREKESTPNPVTEDVPVKMDQTRVVARAAAILTKEHHKWRRDPKEAERNSWKGK